MKSSGPSKTITVVLSVTGVDSTGADAVKSAISHTLGGNKAYPNKVSLVEVENPYTLPYIVKKVVKLNTTDIVIAVAVKVGSIRDPALDSILVPELLHIGISGTIPVIPSIVQSESLLELKAVVPLIFESLARSTDDIIDDLKMAPLEATVTSHEMETTLVSNEAKPIVEAAPLASPTTAAAVSNANAAAGQRVTGNNFLESSPSKNTRQAPGGKSNLVLG